MPQNSSNSPAQRGATGRNSFSQDRSPIGRFLRSRNELSERQRTAVELLLRGMGDLDVATQLKVDRGTIFRWRKSVAFQRELASQRQALWDRSASEMQSLVGPALGVLRKHLSGDDPRLAIQAVGVVMRFATPNRLMPQWLREELTQCSDDPRQQLGDDLIAYVDAPMPGEPGAPEDMEEQEDEEDDDVG